MKRSLAAHALSWIKYHLPTAKPPPRPRGNRDELQDFTYSVLGGISAAMTPEDLAGILSQADEGLCDSQAVLIKEIQEKEPLIGAHLATRKGAVMACPWNVESERHQKEAAEILAMLEAAGLTDAISHLCDYLATGYAMSCALWAEGGRSVSGFMPVAPEAIEFDRGGNIALVDKLGAAHPLADFHPAQFVTLLNRAKPGLPCRNGLGRALVWLYLFKHSGLAGAARYVEKFGSPFMYATVPAGQWGDKATILATLKAMGRDHVGVVREGTDLAEMSGAHAGNTDAQMRFLEYCDQAFTLTILGQLATAGPAGGLSKGQAQENVRMDLLAADARGIMSAVQTSLIVPLCQMRYGWPDADDMKLTIEYEPSEDLDAKATRYKTLTEVTGQTMDVAAIEEEFGVTFSGQPVKPQGTPPPAGEGADDTPPGAQPGGKASGGSGGTRRAAEDFEEGDTLREAALYDGDQPRVPAGNPNGGQWTTTGAVSWTAQSGKRVTVTATLKHVELGDRPSPGFTTVNPHIHLSASVEGMGEVGTAVNAPLPATDPKYKAAGVVSTIGKVAIKAENHAAIMATVAKLQEHPLWQKHEAEVADMLRQSAETNRLLQDQTRLSPKAIISDAERAAKAGHDAFIREFNRQNREALSDSPRAVAALDLIAAEALRRHTADPEASAAWLGPVREAIREAFGDLPPGDVEAFKARVPLFQASLPAVLGRMDSSAFEEQLSGAMLAAVVNGFEEGAGKA